MDRKIILFENYDLTMFGDFVAALAAHVEDTYGMCGVEDYTARDCVEHALDVAKTILATGDPEIMSFALPFEGEAKEQRKSKKWGKRWAKKTT